MTDLHCIVRRYVTSVWFYVDVFSISTSAFDLIDGDVSSLKGLRVVRVLRLFKLVRLLRGWSTLKRYEMRMPINYAVSTAAATPRPGVRLRLVCWLPHATCEGTQPNCLPFALRAALSVLARRAVRITLHCDHGHHLRLPLVCVHLGLAGDLSHPRRVAHHPWALRGVEWHVARRLPGWAHLPGGGVRWKQLRRGLLVRGEPPVVHACAPLLYQRHARRG